MAVANPPQIPLYIVEDHNEALSFILRGIGSKYLNFDNNLLIHFDSHPDLLLNTDLKSEDIFDKETLLEKVSIETWILPLMFAGHVATVVWVKPKWSNQIDEGSYTFYIGETKEKDIKVSSPLLYFVGALNYAPFEELTDPKKIVLHVITLEESQDSIAKCQTQFLKLIKEHDSSYLLDVDLDFFSTLNPFIDMFPNAKMYERLRVIYKFGDEEIAKCSAQESDAKRKLQIDTLEKIFKTLEEMEVAEDKINKVDEVISAISDRNVYNVLKELILDLCKMHGEEVDWEMVHNAGTTIDEPNRELPNHRSTEKEILSYIDHTKVLLKSLSAPKMISVARSSSDDYCPPDIVDFIQENFCKVATEIFNPAIEKHYTEVEPEVVPVAESVAEPVVE